MKFQNVADSIEAMTCIISVEKLPDGSCGEIRIVTGNRAYLDSIEKPVENVEMLTQKFIPNSLYTNYLTRDLNFENACYEAAVHKKCLHSYAHPDRYDVWFNMTFLPLGPDEGNLCYCTYTMEISQKPSAERMSNISSDIAASVLETALTLRASGDDFETAMSYTVNDVRKLCEAEYCCILLVDDEKKSCKILGESFSDSSALYPETNYLEEDFYPIVSSWKATISGSNCLIAKDERDMKVVEQRNPDWYSSLQTAGVKTIALFPLKSRNQLLGYMWVVNFSAENATKIKEIMELTTYVLGMETGNYLMMDKLKVLSSRDMLTGRLNRNEMNNRISRIIRMPKAPVVVLFLDLNELKKINDAQGHRAGDAFLCKAAAVLVDVFDDLDVYRAGGDEFIVIKTGTTLKQMEEKIHHFREESCKQAGVSFAMGCAESENENILQALKEADERMYEDKKAYYQRIGNDRRK
ncbi:MAG: sensor domain-containing diguanylate cyclase [Parasporobacterium sp.]|nr:sensor domain-containing diguanylate cyclase [Parasporobacterium sp.]